ncbi:MAG: shikimate dehydrogenase [Microbacterium sp.]|uniref:shikimate dehydrogenase n=1 Tax=Microbacterium sp. TaxID=51671 RepID=UPI001AD0E5C7|nr:shikimate dehydrogenase [Microbacterium sp.]MBN9178855.1 shikimate dehydrogenase [Microbacterium sp.]
MSHAYLVGLIGSGIGTSSTPALHEREADALGIRYLYRTIDIDELGVAPEGAAELVAAARRLGYDALNVTHPCKQTVWEALDDLSADARLLGAVNTILFRDGRAIGHNTDHSGFAAGLRTGLDDPDLDDVVLLGSGGAGSAIAYALLRAGTRRLSVFDPVVTRAAAVRDALGAAFPDARITPIGTDQVADAVAASDGLVNATPVGMVGHPGTPIDPALLHERLWVADAIYRPLHTELLDAASALGCAVLDGGRMVASQAADTFRLITGVEPDRDRMRAHFLELSGAAGVATSAAQ